jgi:phage baseplate assembly protein gpV
VRRAGEVSALLVADGDPRLRAGRRVRLVGVVDGFEGTYGVSEAVHTIDGTGYTTTVSTRPPEGPAPRGGDRVTLGVVDDADDPEGRARVRVRLVAYPDVVTDWAPVLLAAAGADKGVVALPDEGDTVLVLLPAGDPVHAVVLGALLGAQATHDAGDAGPRGARYSLRTRDGQRVLLDGHARSVTLTDGHGSVVELGPDLVRVTAATDLLIEAPGRGVTLRARTVDFEEAP